MEVLVREHANDYSILDWFETTADLERYALSQPKEYIYWVFDPDKKSIIRKFRLKEKSVPGSMLVPLIGSNGERVGEYLATGFESYRINEIEDVDIYEQEIKLISDKYAIYDGIAVNTILSDLNEISLIDPKAYIQLFHSYDDFDAQVCYERPMDRKDMDRFISELNSTLDLMFTNFISKEKAEYERLKAKYKDL